MLTYVCHTIGFLQLSPFPSPPPSTSISPPPSPSLLQPPSPPPSVATVRWEARNCGKRTVAPHRHAPQLARQALSGRHWSPAGVIRHWSLLEITAQLGIRSAQVAVGVHGVDNSIDVDILISRDGLASHQSSPLPLPTPSPSLLPPPSPSLFAPPSPPPSRTAVGSRMHRLTDRRLSVDVASLQYVAPRALAWVTSQLSRG